MEQTYNEFIQNIINTRGQWGIPADEYFECHHITPRCLGGEPKRYNKKRRLPHKNIIFLYPEEHYIAHKLLALENPDNYQIISAWNYMHQINNKNKIISEKEYARLSEIYSKLKSKEMLGKEPWNKGLTNCYTEETKKLMGQKNIGNKYSAGKIKSLETINKIKEAKRQQDLVSPPHKDIPHSEETKKKLSDLSRKQFENPEARLKVSEGLKRYYKNHPDKINSKVVICIETGECFKSAKAAEEWVRLKTGKGAHISESCRDLTHTKTAGGYHWIYKIEDKK